MAYQKKTITTANIAETKIEDKSKARKYEKDDVIPCKSLTDGKLLVTGEKTGILYRWADYGDVEEIEYQDLVYIINLVLQDLDLLFRMQSLLNSIQN